MSNRRESSISSRDDFLSSFLSQDAMSDPPAADNSKKIQDRNEKKKVQNRVAQRAYRNRMKARIEQLEGMLESQSQSQSKESESHSHQIDGRLDAGASNSSKTATLDGNAPTGLSDHYPSTTGTAQAALHSINVAQSHVWEDKSPQGMQPFTTNSSFVAQRPHSADTLPSQGCVPPKEASAETNSITPHGLFLEVLQSQNKLLNRLDALQRDGWDGSIGNISLTTPPAMEVDTEGTNPQPLVSNHYTSTADMDLEFLPTESTDTPRSSMSVDDRLEYIVDAATKIGYDSFDALAKDYYNHTFEPSSSIARKQRMSRNRRLPTVMSEIFSAANDWCEWERRGLFEEVVRMTESLLISEANDSQNLLEDKLEHFIKTSAQATDLMGTTSRIDDGESSSPA
ncbi:bzip transcription factor, bzip-1 [Fusarium flagelliforme]|uniref:Bzip transcription factor, bzip-1 n=1 Tax=Fusarium flagelliforme TaxID=2675880 RepID=A0A395MYN4_9HYPO|nr:bzip transcription factor, bzip-1 [Fusarium flagelliforme]